MPPVHPNLPQFTPLLGLIGVNWGCLSAYFFRGEKGAEKGEVIVLNDDDDDEEEEGEQTAPRNT